MKILLVQPMRLCSLQWESKLLYGSSFGACRFQNEFSLSYSVLAFPSRRAFRERRSRRASFLQEPCQILWPIRFGFRWQRAIDEVCLTACGWSYWNRTLPGLVHD